jgi:hypothetical protein
VFTGIVPKGFSLASIAQLQLFVLSGKPAKASLKFVVPIRQTGVDITETPLAAVGASAGSRPHDT